MQKTASLGFLLSAKQVSAYRIHPGLGPTKVWLVLCRPGPSLHLMTLSVTKLRQLPAIDKEQNTGDIGCIFGGEEEGRASHFLRCSHASERDHARLRIVLRQVDRI